MTARSKNPTKTKQLSQSFIGIAILLAFALPLLWLVGTKYVEPVLWQRYSGWQPVPGTLESVSTDRVVIRAVTRGITVSARYSYDFDVRTYYASRVGFARHYQTKGRQEAADAVDAIKSQQPLTVYVDPKDPTRSVLLKDDSGRLPLFAALVFGLPGVGFALCALFVLVRAILS